MQSRVRIDLERAECLWLAHFLEQQAAAEWHSVARLPRGATTLQGLERALDAQARFNLKYRFFGSKRTAVVAIWDELRAKTCRGGGKRSVITLQLKKKQAYLLGDLVAWRAPRRERLPLMRRLLLAGTRGPGPHPKGAMLIRHPAWWGQLIGKDFLKG
jgi:hypothetical protein